MQLSQPLSEQKEAITCQRLQINEEGKKWKILSQIFNVGFSWEEISLFELFGVSELEHRPQELSVYVLFFIKKSDKGWM